jgi:Flp pilus assembly protein TadG
MSDPEKREERPPLFGDNRGAVAVIFALSVVPIVLAAGAAIDYIKAAEKKSFLQQAMDAGVIAAAAHGSTGSSYLQNYLNANLKSEQASVTNAVLTTQTAADGSVTYKGDASFAVPVSLLRMTGLTSITVAAHSEATRPARVVSAIFTPQFTQGAYSKDIFFWTKDATGKVTSRQTILTYRYSSSTGSKVTTPAIGSQFTFTVPQYSTYGLGMVAYQDWQNYTGALINPVEMWTDASNVASFLKQTGSCSDTGGATYNWEDGGNSDFMDFVYNMKCTTGVASDSLTRLVK